MSSVAEIASTLAAAGVPSPEHDARVLVQLAAERTFPLEELVSARAARVPLQHLTGTTGFRYLDLEVGPGVFVPRPETELLVDVVLAALRDVPVERQPLVVDLGAGSGAIGLSVAHEDPRPVVHLVERFPAAFEWLQRNADALDAGDRVQLHLADLGDAPTGLGRSVDVVVSNPPYVPADEYDLVEPEVRNHDPGEALWADDGGLAVIRRVAERGLGLLRPGGTLVVEHSERHNRSVPELLRDAGYRDVTDHDDLTGRSRFSVGNAP